MPDDLARDSVIHSWPACRDALVSLLDENPLPAWIASPSSTTTVVLGTDDPRAPATHVLDWTHDLMNVVVLQGDPLLPITHPAKPAELVVGWRCGRKLRRLVG